MSDGARIPSDLLASDRLRLAISEVRSECSEVLGRVMSTEARQRLHPYDSPDSAFLLLSRHGSQVQDSESPAVVLPRMREQACGLPVDRILLLLAVLKALEQLVELRVSHRVKELFLDEFRFFANPPEAYLERFRWEDVRYREMTAIATFGRYPGGQIHWSNSGIPISWMLRSVAGLAACARIFTQLGGRRPFWETHLNDRRKYRIVILERETNLSYYRMAKSMELQPEIKGMTSTSWFFCAQTAKYTPSLAWARRIPESGGAFFFEVGPAPADAGFLVGSKERRELFEKGVYRPTDTCCIWPRDAMIAWANRHPEFDD